MSSYSTNPAQKAANKFNEFGGASTVKARIMAQQAGNPSAWRDYMNPTAAQTRPLWTPTPEAAAPVSTPAMPAANPLFSADELSNIASLNQRDAALQTPKSFSFSGMQGQMPGDIAAKAVQNQPVAAAPNPTQGFTGGVAWSGMKTPNANDMSIQPAMPKNQGTPQAASMPMAYSGGSTGAMPQQTAFPTKTPEQISAEAKARTDALLAKQTTIANQTKQGFQTAFDRTNALTQDNRTLQGVQLKRNLNPFAGQSQEKQDMVQRQWSIEDSNDKQDLQSRLANVDLSLADYANATEAQRMEMEDKMIQQERAYAATQDQLALQRQAQQNSQFNADRSFNYGVNRDNVGDARYSDTTGYNRGRDAKSDSINADNTAYNRDRDALTDSRYTDTTNYNRGQDQIKNDANKAAVERQSKVDNWNAYMQSVGMTQNLGSGAKADWSLLGGADGEPTADAKAKYLAQEGTRLNNELAKLQLENYPQEQKLKIQQLQKQIDQIGRAPYQSAVDAEYDKIKLDTAKEQLTQLRNKPNETKPLTASSYKTNPDFADEIATVQANPGNALAKIQEHAQALVQAYGYDGYQELVRAATPKQ